MRFPWPENIYNLHNIELKTLKTLAARHNSIIIMSYITASTNFILKYFLFFSYTGILTSQSTDIIQSIFQTMSYSRASGNNISIYQVCINSFCPTIYKPDKFGCGPRNEEPACKRKIIFFTK